jgi:chromosome segregation ATPase
MLKELPGELNRKLKRMQSSRDNLKADNKEKAGKNKKLRDRNVELTESRDKWKSRCQNLEKTLGHQKDDFQLQLKAADKAIAEEKLHAEKERERADRLQVEVEEVKKKYKTLKALFQK